MTDTPRLSFPEISSSQSQKEITHNEALKMLDAFVFCGVEDKDLTAPPGGETNGQCWIVASGATGAWAGHDLDIAQRYNSGWTFYDALEGWIAWVKDEDALYAFNGSTWGLIIAGTLTERNVDIMDFPEYPGALMIAPAGYVPNAGNAMTSDSEVVSNILYNYYQWISSLATGLQEYEFTIKWKVPYNFTGFQAGTNQALTLDLKTLENTTTNNKLDITISKDGSATTSALTAQKSATADTWETIGFDETDTVLNGLVAGDVLNIRIRLYSQNSKYVRIGKINRSIKVQ